MHGTEKLAAVFLFSTRKLTRTTYPITWPQLQPLNPILPVSTAQMPITITPPPPLSPHTHAHSPLQQNLQNVSRFGLAVRSQAGKQKDLGSNLLRLSFLFKSCLWTLSCDFVPHNYETLKWLSSLPILMQKSF